jgi:hypothetical protein
MVFLDSKDEMIGYQLDKSTLKKMKFLDIKFPVEPPEGTKKAVVIKEVRSMIVYEKKNIADEMARVVTYQIQDGPYYVQKLIRDNLSQNLLLA